MLATRSGTETRLAALDFRDWTATFPQIARALERLAPARLAIDGVVCVLDERGVPAFEPLRAAVARTGHVTSAVLICWDLLWEGDDDLRTRPLAERRGRLAALLAGAAQPLMMSEALSGTVARVVVAAKELGLRGWSRVRARETTRPRGTRTPRQRSPSIFAAACRRRRRCRTRTRCCTHATRSASATSSATTATSRR